MWMCVQMYAIVGGPGRICPEPKTGGIGDCRRRLGSPQHPRPWPRAQWLGLLPHGMVGHPEPAGVPDEALEPRPVTPKGGLAVLAAAGDGEALARHLQLHDRHAGGDSPPLGPSGRPWAQRVGLRSGGWRHWRLRAMAF